MLDVLGCPVLSRPAALVSRAAQETLSHSQEGTTNMMSATAAPQEAESRAVAKRSYDHEIEDFYSAPSQTAKKCKLEPVASVSASAVEATTAKPGKGLKTCPVCRTLCASNSSKCSCDHVFIRKAVAPRKALTDSSTEKRYQWCPSGKTCVGRANKTCQRRHYSRTDIFVVQVNHPQTACTMW